VTGASNEGDAKQQVLDQFLVGNEDLEELTAKLSGFNLFDVLKIGRAEIRHGNVLAWLLSPTESHSLGDLFLRRFLSRLLLDRDFPQVALTSAVVELMPLRDVEVRREWQNIDLLAHSRAEKWVLLVENKIGAKESSTQLVRYLERAKERFPAFGTMQPQRFSHKTHRYERIARRSGRRELRKTAQLRRAHLGRSAGRF